MHTRDDLEENQRDTIVTYTNSESGTDTDYLDFGYWLVLTPIDDMEDYFIQTFANGSISSGSVGHVEGSASYVGPATGQYTRKTRNVYVESGQFTAEASLTARFNDPEVAEADRFTISGSISNFKNSNGSVIDAAWTLDLNEVGHDPKDDSPRDLPSGTTTGGKTWRYEYFGALDSNDGSVQPSAVGGTFRGHFSNGSVIGAFVASKE